MRHAVAFLAVAVCAAALAACSSSTDGQASSSGSCIGSGCSASLDPRQPTVPAPPTGAVAATTIPAPTPVQTYSGNGNDVVDLTTPVTVGILTFDCPKCPGNTMVKSDAGIDEDLVHNFTSNSYSGKRWLGMRGGTTSHLQITAKGAWTVKIGGLETASQYDATSPVSGKGDDVFLYRVSPQKVAATHNGSSNFAVWVMTDRLSGPDLAVNEIGKYSGTVLFPASGSDAALVQITANGAWTITPK